MPSTVRRRHCVALALTATTLILTTTPADATNRTTDVFTTIPTPPGHPEGIAVEHDGTVYTGTHQSATGENTGPSRVYAYDHRGRLQREYVIEGQQESPGILGIALDAAGDLYINDRHPARVIRLDPGTGQQHTYATFADVPPCTGAPDGTCSATREDRASYADDLVFAPDGTLYATDIEQALIWRIPPGGGEAEIWYTHPDLDAVFGPNGIRFLDRDTLVFAQSLHDLHDPDQIFEGHGRIYTLDIRRDGTPGTRTTLWEGVRGEAPDGVTVGITGTVYTALALPGAVVAISPSGRELWRTPGSPEENAELEVPYNLPASLAFLGNRLLITNQAFFGGPPEEHAVLRTRVADFGMPLFRPCIR